MEFDFTSFNTYLLDISSFHVRLPYDFCLMILRRWKKSPQFGSFHDIIFRKRDRLLWDSFDGLLLSWPCGAENK